MVLEDDIRTRPADARDPVRADAVADLRQRALDQIGAAIVFADVDGRILDWSDGATRLFGWTRDEAVGRTWDDLTGPITKDPDPRRARIVTALAQEGQYAGELTVLTKAGRRIPILVEGRYVHDDDGRVIGRVGVAFDDSRRSAAEDRFEVAFRDSPMASVITVAPQHRILDVNPAFEQLAGYARADVIGRTSDELGLWGTPGASGALLAMTLDGAPIDAVAVRGRDGRGQVLEARLYGRPIVLSDGPAYLWTVIDETDRVQAERTSKAVASRLEAIVQASPMAIGMLDAERRVRLWNPAAERLTGYAAEEVIGQESPIHAIETDEAEAMQLRAATGGPDATGTLTITVRDGRLVRTMQAFAPIEGAEGEGPSLVVMAVDVTEREAMEAQLRQAQKMESIGHLAGGLAHDFNNLMTVISGYASMISETLGPDHPAGDDLVEIGRATERASGLTRQLLAFSRQQVMQPEVIDLDVVVSELAPMLGRLVGPGIVLHTRRVSTPSWVVADPTQIQQVVVNLVVNARDAMPDGGELSIGTRVVPGQDIVELEIADTGEGMTEDIRERLFEPFFTIKAAGKGTGLGLAVVDGIVSQSGGRIQVESTLGTGTTVRVSLPAAAGPPDGLVSPVAAPTPPRRATGGTILVAEDEVAIRLLARRVLEGAGHEVVIAEDGEQALELGRDMPRLDLLLTDLTMPRMGGRELALALGDSRPGLPVLYMSGFGEDRLAEDGVLPRGIRLLPKPFGIAELVAAVDEVLASAS